MKRSWILVALALVAAPQLLSASTFVDMGTRDLLRESSAVIEGEVLQVESFWESAGRIIVTEAMVQVREVLAGEAPSVVRVRTFGGTVGGFRVEAIGFPTFEKGEHVVLFLGPDREADTLRVTGYQLGQYRIRRAEDGFETAVSAARDSGHLVTPEGGAADRPTVLPLGALKQLVRSEAARLRREPAGR
jgi:hypothetical protein